MKEGGSETDTDRGEERGERATERWSKRESRERERAHHIGTPTQYVQMLPFDEARLPV